MSPRSEPLLWVQLVNGGALPLEALLLLLLLAGADPGPLPALERLLAWALGAAAPALLLWKRPADPRSLLLLSGTAAGGLELESSLAALGHQPLLRWAFGLGVIGLLPLLVWLDGTAALASQLSPLQGSGRLTGLMASAGVLALMVWQWQQLVQAVWLLSQDGITTTEPAAAQTSVRRLGLPLLRLPQLLWPEPAPTAALTSPVSLGGPSLDVQSFDNQTLDDPSSNEEPTAEASTTETAAADSACEAIDAEAVATETLQPDPPLPEWCEPEVHEQDVVEAPATEAEVIEPEIIDPEPQPAPPAPLDSSAPLAVEPEQPTEHDQGRDLDQQIS